jgi:hypothetical protein
VPDQSDEELDDELDDEPAFEEALLPELSLAEDPDDESDDDVEDEVPDDSAVLDEESFAEASEDPDAPSPVPPDAPALVADFLPRLSVLKKPLPLNVTPTGWKTFLTGLISPDVGCSASVSVSSVNDCCTSIVSPVSTNL